MAKAKKQKAKQKLTVRSVRFSVNKKSVAEAVAYLLRYKKKDVVGMVAAYRKLPAGRQREFGTAIAYLVSMLEQQLILEVADKASSSHRRGKR